MQRLALGFCGGALSLGLPWPADWALPLAAACAAAGLVLAASRRLRYLWWTVGLGVLLGVGWGAAAQRQGLTARLDHMAAGGAVPLDVHISSVPERLPDAPGRGSGVRFQARVVAGPVLDGKPTAGTQVRLTWYGAPALRHDETWRLQVTLKGPWSYANPGGFDYERWLLGADIQATGWIRGGHRLAPAPPSRLEQIRSTVADSVTAAGLRHGGVLLALLLGRTDGIDNTTWDFLRTTGTVHLMVISGLHVSLATALGFFLGAWAWRCAAPALAWLDARRAGCAAGAAAALAYVALAGAGLPALRALLMSSALLVLMAGGRTSQVSGLLLVALVAVLLIEPLAVHQQGFWLSFAAVGILLLALGRRHGDGGAVRRLARAQLALSVGMLPLVALTTGSVPWWSIPANLLAVPLMSLCVVPAALLGGVCAVLAPGLAVWPLSLADRILVLLLAWLEWLGASPVPLTAAAPFSLVAAQGAALCLIAGVPRRHAVLLAACAVLPLLPSNSNVAHGAYRVTALDVGQGSAIVVDTRRHRLLYDTGPGFPSGFETGSAVVIPSLAATGPARLDVLILSHDDLDHVGGAEAVRRALPPQRLLAGQPGRGAHGCHGREWEWDGVTFSLLQPRRPPAASDNDLSCVLLMDDGRQATLIAGDISARVESSVLRLLAQRAPLALMFAPHHGSASSSSHALVRVLRPRRVFVSAARGNRFGHPHPAVVERYRAVGAQLHQTGLHGALMWSSDAPQRVVRWRRDRAPYWRAVLPTATASRR